eukprot:721949-Hanusia_phi.AAC.1
MASGATETVAAIPPTWANSGNLKDAIVTARQIEDRGPYRNTAGDRREEDQIEETATSQSTRGREREKPP